MFTSLLWNWASTIWLVAIAMLIAYIIAFRIEGKPRLWVLVIGLSLLTLALCHPSACWRMASL